MIEQLKDIIQQYGQKEVVANPAVPDEHNEPVMQEANTSIISGLQNMVQDGHVEQVTDLLQGNNNGTAANQLSSGFAENIMKKFGINGETAKNIAGSLIPKVLGSLSNKAKDPNDKSIDVAGIIKSLTSGNGGNYKNIINSVGSQFGLDKDKDGDVDLSDVTKMFRK